MALTQSVDQVDENGREILTYGTEDFPIAFFDDDLKRTQGLQHAEFRCWQNTPLLEKGRIHCPRYGPALSLP